MYEATLVEVPPRVALASYKKKKVPILDQGREGACTGFGLATDANYLLRYRRIHPEKTSVSLRLMCKPPKRHDEWSRDNYEVSNARGAMKGWDRGQS